VRSVRPRSEVSVALPGAVAIRIWQRFEATVQSRQRLRTQLIESKINVERGGRSVESRAGPVGGGVLAVPIQLAAAGLGQLGQTFGGGGGGGSGGGGEPGAAGADVLASVTQLGAEVQTSKMQLVTFLDAGCRVTRDDTSFSVYTRE